jgi:heme/copper-type cytochrome/quinol oxidase subunit 2
MEDVVDLIGGILMFLLRTAVFALFLVLLLIGAIFSPSLRGNLISRWKSSSWEQASMITGVLLGIGILVVVFTFVVPWYFSSDEEAASPGQSAESVEEQKETGETLRDKAIEKGAEYLKKKLRKEE